MCDDGRGDFSHQSETPGQSVPPVCDDSVTSQEATACSVLSLSGNTNSTGTGTVGNNESGDAACGDIVSDSISLSVSSAESSELASEVPRVASEDLYQSRQSLSKAAAAENVLSPIDESAEGSSSLPAMMVEPVPVNSVGAFRSAGAPCLQHTGSSAVGASQCRCSTVTPLGVDGARKTGAASRMCCDRLWRTLRTLRLKRPLRLTSSHSLPSTCAQCSCSCSANGAGAGVCVARRSAAVSHREMARVASFTAADPDSQQQQQRTVHTTVDFVHCLVPELREINDKPYYWGAIDRYQAERALGSRPEGTFLLRDSAQEEHLFSVSFRRYDRSLHARIEQSNGRFTFDAHDPSVFASATIAGLIDHYKDPSCCNFFEPLLTLPLHRTDVFTLMHLCRAVIVSLLNYDDINRLCLPRALRLFLMEYHYKQRVGVRRLELPD